VRTSIAVLLAVLLAGCSGGSRTGATNATGTAKAVSLKPPFRPTSAAPRSIARFPCPKHPISTIDLESCSARRVLALNVRINERIKLIWFRLDGTGRRYFQRAERAWAAYLTNECTSRSRGWIDPAHPHAYVGGASAPVAYGVCAEDLSAAHLHDLVQTAAQLAPH
jgi:uncharacterized protein YecT (DUF1311 family)